MSASLVGSEMCIRDSECAAPFPYLGSTRCPRNANANTHATSDRAALRAAWSVGHCFSLASHVGS
eukprot:13783842-Alexandrium_andersonii.AAC.1